LTKANGRVELLIEIKGQGEMVNQLFNADPTIRANSRNKIIELIRAARERGQVVRVHAGGNAKIQEFIDGSSVLKEIKGYPAYWVHEFKNGLRDGEKPNNAARAAWQQALDQTQYSTVATDFPLEFIEYMRGRCDDGTGNYKLVNTGSGRCLDVPSSSTANGTQVQIYDCNGTTAQSWKRQNRGNGNSTLVNVNSNKCLDVRSSGTTSGTPVQIYDCNGTAAQGWYFEPLQNWPNHYVVRSNNNNDMCLDVAGGGTANRTLIQQATCNYTSAQFWELHAA